MLITTQLLHCPLGLFVARAPVALRIYKIVPGTPVDGILQVGDFILMVNNVAVPRCGPVNRVFTGNVRVTAWRPPFAIQARSI
jgi:hypothetical protein